MNSPLSPLRRIGLWCAGVDGSESNLQQARNRNLFDEYHCADILEWLRQEVKSGAKWEVVIASHVIEHFEREKGEELLMLAEQVSPRLLYIETPNGFVEPGWQPDPLDALARHRSGWFPWDLEARGYSVFGMGIRGLRGRSGIASESGKLLRTLDRSLQWVNYRRPSGAATIAGIRYVDEAGSLRILNGR